VQCRERRSGGGREGGGLEFPEEEEEVIVEADKGEMLVLRRALNSQRSEKQEQSKELNL